MTWPECIALQFDLNGRIHDIKPYGTGNINRTFLVTTDTDPPEKIILQQINPQVFRQPGQVMENMIVVTRHMLARSGQQDSIQPPWQVPRIVKTRKGEDYHIDQADTFWRAVTYIDNTLSYETVQDDHQAETAGVALARFHRLTRDLDPKRLHDTLPGFHHTPEYLHHYDQVRQSGSGRSMESQESVRICSDFIADHRTSAGVLEVAKKEGLLAIRAIHGDPKISNILFCAETGQPVSLIDLDTVKPGLLHYDIGDFLRSACNPAGEETMDLEAVCFDIHRCQAGLAGYFSEAGSFLTTCDIGYIFDAIRLMTFELGLRFFTDFLAGDRYFKTTCDTHNLQRAQVQFKLAESILNQEGRIHAIIEENAP